MDHLLAELKLRGNEDCVMLENIGRYTGATLYLLSVLCSCDGVFAGELAEDPRLLAKLQLAMSIKVHESCRRPLIAIIDTLINQAPYPANSRSGEQFRKGLFVTVWAVRTQWPAMNMIITPISKKIMEGADDEFQVRFLTAFLPFLRKCRSHVPLYPTCHLGRCEPWTALPLTGFFKIHWFFSLLIYSSFLFLVHNSSRSVIFYIFSPGSSFLPETNFFGIFVVLKRTRNFSERTWFSVPENSAFFVSLRFLNSF